MGPLHVQTNSFHFQTDIVAIISSVRQRGYIMMLSLFLDNRRKCVLRDVIAVKNEFIFLRGFRLQSDSNNEAKTLTALKVLREHRDGSMLYVYFFY